MLRLVARQLSPYVRQGEPRPLPTEWGEQRRLYAPMAMGKVKPDSPSTTSEITQSTE